MPCKALTLKGKPCQAPETVVRPSGYCGSHDPALAEERRLRGQRGGFESAKRWHHKGLSPVDLGELKTPEDCRRWLEKIGQAVACGTLTASAGAACVRALDIALKAIDAGKLSDEISDLRAQLNEFKRLRAS